MSKKAKKVGMFLLMAPALLFSGGRDLLGLAAQAEGIRSNSNDNGMAENTLAFEIESSKELDPEALARVEVEATQKLRLRRSEKPIFTIENAYLKSTCSVLGWALTQAPRALKNMVSGS